MATWHDTLFRFTFGQVQNARALLRRAVPRRLAAAIDWTSLRPWPATRTGPNLRLHHGDLLFMARLRGTRVRIFFLIEHKSGRDPALLRQLHRYVVHIVSELAVSAAATPCVVPVVVHHGRGPLRNVGWRSARSLPGAVATALAAFDPRLRIVLDELAGLGERELRARPLPALGLLTCLCLRFLPRMRDPEALAALERWGDLVRAVARSRGGQLAMEAISSYFLHQTDLSPELLSATLARAIQRPTEGSIMSTADRLIAKGKAEGRVEGRVEGEVEGRAKIVLRLLTARFGSLPTQLESRIRAAAADDLDRWALRILDAKSLTDVFGPAPRT